MVGKIIGLGGVFVKSFDKPRLCKWYQDVFEIRMEDWGTTFNIKDISKEEIQVFSVFPNETNYCHNHQSYMINWMVDDLSSLIEKLKKKNIIVTMGEESEFGKFAWLDDCDGNKLELWEPPKSTNN
jgi:predicted enzyme related to lactoylglutathione lyase